MDHACAAPFHRDLVTQSRSSCLFASPPLPLPLPPPLSFLLSISGRLPFSSSFDFHATIEAEPPFACLRKTHTGIESRSPYQITVPSIFPSERVLLSSAISKQVVSR